MSGITCTTRTGEHRINKGVSTEECEYWLGNIALRAWEQGGMAVRVAPDKLLTYNPETHDTGVYIIVND